MSESPLPEETKEAPEILTEMKQPKISKIEEKRQQIFRDRVHRKMSGGMTENKAVQSVMQEDYNAMPLDKKFARLEMMVANAIQQLMNNVNTIRQNEHVVADAFDTNYRAIDKMFQKLGITPEQQQEFMAEARKEVAADHIKEMEAKAAERQPPSEQTVVSAELNQVEQKPLQTAAETGERPEGVDPHVEGGATEFGS